jgi:hypothetical protein
MTTPPQSIVCPYEAEPGTNIILTKNGFWNCVDESTGSYISTLGKYDPKRNNFGDIPPIVVRRKAVRRRLEFDDASTAGTYDDNITGGNDKSISNKDILEQLSEIKSMLKLLLEEKNKNN